MIGVGAAGPTGGEARAMAIERAASASPIPSIGPEDRPFWLAFSLVPGLGPIGFARLLGQHGSAAAAWEAGEAALRDLPRLPTEAHPGFAALRRIGAQRVATRLEAGTRAAGGHVLTPLDTGYPVALLAVEARPPVLHVVGDDASLAGRAVAVVGTRRPSGYGLSCATEIGDELARAGVIVVSGLALGIDGAAHRAALAAAGRTVAVLPTPIDRIYPLRHAALAREIVAGGGAMVSELAVGHAVGRPDFARRNRIIAGLAEAVVVVEAPDRSGALLTAAAAIQLGRELHAVPGPIDAATSRGCNRLIADQQAIIVTSAASLLRQIGLERGQAPPSVTSLSDAEALILAHLLKRSGSIEELIDRTRLAAGSVASGLTMLEVRGLAASFGGATFHPTLAARRLAHHV